MQICRHIKRKENERNGLKSNQNFKNMEGIQSSVIEDTVVNSSWASKDPSRLFTYASTKEGRDIDKSSKQLS